MKSLIIRAGVPKGIGDGPQGRIGANLIGKQLLASIFGRISPVLRREINRMSFIPLASGVVWIMRAPVSNRLYQLVMDENATGLMPARAARFDNHNQARTFIKALNEKAGRSFRIATEQELFSAGGNLAWTLTEQEGVFLRFVLGKGTSPDLLPHREVLIVSSPFFKPAVLRLAVELNFSCR